jgi:hypothetical protein
MTTEVVISSDQQLNSSGGASNIAQPVETLPTPFPDESSRDVPDPQPRQLCKAVAPMASKIVTTKETPRSHLLFTTSADVDCIPKPVTLVRQSPAESNLEVTRLPQDTAGLVVTPARHDPRVPRKTSSGYVEIKFFYLGHTYKVLGFGCE